jgi:hypothetical protein
MPEKIDNIYTLTDAMIPCRIKLGRYFLIGSCHCSFPSATRIPTTAEVNIFEQEPIM